MARAHWLALDQVASSASNALLVLLVARQLNVGSFAVFASAQLVVLSLMGVARLGLYSPALSTQRAHGRLRVPSAWVVPASMTLASTAALIVFVLSRFQAARVSHIDLLALCLAPVVVVTQDGFRYVRLSEGRFKLVLLSDLAWLCTTIPIVALAADSISETAFAWGGGAGVGLVVLLTSRESSLPLANLQDTWLVGRWGAMDATLAAIIVSAPTLATSVTDEALVGAYRVVQSAVSPLNVINNVLVVSFGLEAWRLSQANGTAVLRRNVRWATALLLALATALTLLAVPIALKVADIELAAAARPWAVVGLASLIGAWMSARIAAANAMGMQRISALTRATSTLFTCLAIYLVVGIEFSSDAIGLSLLGSAVIGLAGSQLAYARGLATITKKARGDRD